MEAGRELDALVAEKVMGWTITHRGRRVMKPDGREICGLDNTEDCRRFIASSCPSYSTSIAAAWEVVEKLGAGGYAMYLGGIGPYSCSFYKDDNVPDIDDMELADTAPLAICLAALKAVEG